MRTLTMILFTLVIGCGTVTMLEPDSGADASEPDTSLERDAAPEPDAMVDAPDCDLYLVYVDNVIFSPEVDELVIRDYVFVNETGAEVNINDIYFENTMTEPQPPVTDTVRWGPVLLIPTDYAVGNISSEAVYTLMQPYVSVETWQMETFAHTRSRLIPREVSTFVYTADILATTRKGSIRVEFQADPDAIVDYVPQSVSVACLD